MPYAELIPTPEDNAKLIDAMTVARRLTEQLQNRSMLLGYNVTATTGIKYGVGAEPSTQFQVWRVDRDPPPLPSEEPLFSSAEEVEQRLAEIATWPTYALDLTGNPEIEEIFDDSPFSVIIVRSSGEELVLRTRDLETVTTLRVHAEERPAKGNWRPVD